LATLQAAAQPGAFAALLSRFDGTKPPDQELIGNVLSQQMGIPESWKARVTKYFIKSNRSQCWHHAFRHDQPGSFFVYVALCHE
jgi:hypothetical protein